METGTETDGEDGRDLMTAMTDDGEPLLSPPGAFE
jgi:hypothetical protein